MDGSWLDVLVVMKVVVLRFQHLIGVVVGSYVLKDIALISLSLGL